MLTGLYISQGLPMGLALVALPAILRSLGYSTQAIGAVGLVILPWALKFLWAPLVDRDRQLRLGRRRGWILPAQIAMVLLYLSIGLIAVQTGAASWILGLLILANLVSATQDIATDGWAVELLRGPELAWVNGLQIGGFALGMLIGGSASLMLFDRGGWMILFVTLAIVTALTIIPVARIRETGQQAQPSPDRFQPAPSLRATFARRGAWRIMAIAASFYFANTLSGAMLGPFFIDRGLSLAEVGIVTGTGIAGVAVVGGIVGGWITGRVGAMPAAIGGGLLSAISLGLWIVVASLPSLTLGIAIATMSTTGLIGGVAYVAFYTLFMNWASLDQAGTDFTVLQCTESWTNMAASVCAGFAAAAFGFRGVFVLAVIVGLGLIGLIILALKGLSINEEKEYA